MQFTSLKEHYYAKQYGVRVVFPFFLFLSFLPPSFLSFFLILLIDFPPGGGAAPPPSKQPPTPKERTNESPLELEEEEAFWHFLADGGQAKS